ncbi:inorganic pyrophosphatase [Astrocystis sublimbata]|nr:inorganic pyrophosphatase [Astrocystis sublimbata]
MSSSLAMEQILPRRAPALLLLATQRQPQGHAATRPARAAAAVVRNPGQRANHAVSTRSLVGLRCGSWPTPPPPSPLAPPYRTPPARTITTAAAAATSPSRASAAATISSSPHPRRLCSHPRPFPTSFPLLSVGTSTPVVTIASRRSAQLARHFSGSPSSSYNPDLHEPAPSQLPAMASPYTIRKVAAPNTLEHRVYIEQDGVPLSPFHDIPLYANKERTILNMIVEIPRWTNAKLEISKDELLNPIKQDIKKGKLRFVRNCFPHKGYLWNYGALPQTWEDPNSVHPETKAKGDNDPLDVCEIGELVGYTGQVKQVKVLGVMALLDEEETDWKVIVVDVNDPLAPKLNDVEDVERHLPGLLRATNEWFRIYKIPDGKPENQFAFTGECKNKDYANDVITECAEAWEKLITGKTKSGGISTTNLTVAHSPSRVSPNDLPPLPPNENKAPEPIDSSIDKWFFISGAAS